jgi:hypothetical protein
MSDCAIESTPLGNNVIAFPDLAKSNGAREALMRILRNRSTRVLGDWDVPAVTDYMLALLWMDGFMIVPVSGGNDAA